jgi:transcriptional regulator NrdR family protein
MATMLSNRRSTFAITCVQCHEELIAPDKSEYRAGTHIRHLWHCSNCSARFESIEQIPVEAIDSGRYLSGTSRRVVQFGRACGRR